MHERQRTGNLDVRGACRTDDELVRRFHLCAIRRQREEFRRRDDRPDHFTNVSGGFSKPCCGPLNECGRRYIRDELPCQLRGNEPRGRRVRGEDIEYTLAVLLAAATVDPMPQDHLLAVIMNPRLELEASALPGHFNRPTGECAGYVLHVLLGVAAVHAERMQFHELAGVIFVEPARRPTSPVLPVLVRRRTLPVIEVEEHRRTVGRRAKQVSKFPEHVGPDHVALVLGQIHARRSLAGKHVEVVEPKVDEHFFELPLAVHRSHDSLLRQFGEHRPVRSHRVHLFWGSFFAGHSGLDRCGNAVPRALLLLTPSQHQCRDEVFLRQHPRRFLKGLERREPGCEVGV